MTKIKQALKPGGKVIVEVFTENHYSQRLDSTDWQMIKEGGFWSPKAYLELNSFTRYSDNLVLIQAGVIDNTSIGIWNSWIQIFTPSAIEAELRLAGFSKLYCYGSCCGEKYTSESEVLCICAE